MLLRKTTNDVTHNANFERVILIYVTDITLYVSEYCSSNFSVENGHVSCRLYEMGEWNNNKSCRRTACLTASDLCQT